MWLPSIFAFGRSALGRNLRLRAPTKARRSPRLNLEQLEDRTLLSSYTAGSVSDLIADINAANRAGGTNTITLTAPTTSPYILTAVDNKTDGPTGLPVISGGNKADNLTIVGNGDTIERSTASGTPDLRLLDVASGASLTLNNLTLQNGYELGSGSSAEGGAIFNQGTLVLSAVTVQNNGAVGSAGKDGTNKDNAGAGADAAGGGIWSSGSLTCENGTVIQGSNFAAGGNGGNAAQVQGAHGGNGGNAFGGGVDIAGGTANVSGTTLSGNVALGGKGGAGVNGFDGCCVAGSGGIGGNAEGGAVYVASGSATLSGDTLENNTVYAGVSSFAPRLSAGLGGGIYVAAGIATLCNDTIESNSATVAGSGGFGAGGGIYIVSGATVYIDSFTVTNTINNTDSWGLNSSTANIDGTYILQNC